MEVNAAIGLAAAPGIIAAVVQVLKPLLIRMMPADLIPVVAVLLGIVYCLLLWEAGVLEADNAIVAGLLGLVTGLGATGAYEVVHQSRQKRAPVAE
jgi:hypothetical protein